MMKRKQRGMQAYAGDIVFLPAITPLEASVLPAVERKPYAALGMIRRAYDAGNKGETQRTKIWVR